MDNIEDVVKKVFEEFHQKNPSQRKNVEDTWKRLVSSEEQKHTKLVGVKEGEILVFVDSSAWLYQMRTKQTRLLEDFKKECPYVQSINLRLGSTK